MNRDFKGVWIPKEIWLNNDLGWSEKFLLVEIDSLATNGECFASNSYFAEFFNLSKRQISRLISNLKEKGYIDVIILYKDDSKQIEKRIIKPCYMNRQQSQWDNDKNGDNPPDKNGDTPPDKNGADNNIDINNIDISIYPASPKTPVEKLKSRLKTDKKPENTQPKTSENSKPKAEKVNDVNNTVPRDERLARKHVDKLILNTVLKKDIFKLLDIWKSHRWDITIEHVDLLLEQLEHLSDGSFTKKLKILAQSITAGIPVISRIY